MSVARVTFVKFRLTERTIDCTIGKAKVSSFDLFLIFSPLSLLPVEIVAIVFVRNVRHTNVLFPNAIGLHQYVYVVGVMMR